jgi:hypothetical protein
MRCSTKPKPDIVGSHLKDIKSKSKFNPEPVCAIGAYAFGTEGGLSGKS